MAVVLLVECNKRYVKETKMAQLVMRWKNDGKIVEELNIPEGVEIKNWMEVESPVDKWLDIIQYGLSIKREDEEFYKKANYQYEHYKPEDCFFFTYKKEEIATMTLICDLVKKEGYVHMVAAKPEARGKGIGNLMAFFAVKVFKEKGMQTAYLTTDDFRIPAIKTYLKSGFYADLSSDDFKDRWNKIFEIIEK